MGIRDSISKNFMRNIRLIQLTFIVLLLALFLLLKLFWLYSNINISSNLIVFSSGLTIIFLVAILTLEVLIRENRERAMTKELYNLPREFVNKLKEIYQILNECERRSYNPSKTLSKVLPHVIEVIEKYKNELYKLPRHISLSFYEIYTSTMGKHGHYHDKRKEKNLNDLRKGIGKLIFYLEKYGQKYQNYL
jgi:hypothetical protein